MKPHRVAPGPGQESVWDYPRPPRLEPVTARLQVELAGACIADTSRGYRVLETSHPPTYYVPLADVQRGVLSPSERMRDTVCEFKGRASHYAVAVGRRREDPGAWRFTVTTPAFDAIRECVGFYAARMDACYVGDEPVSPQEGPFYGGWITASIVGPFKGGPGTWGW